MASGDYTVTVLNDGRMRVFLYTSAIRQFVRSHGYTPYHNAITIPADSRILLLIQLKFSHITHVESLDVVESIVQSLKHDDTLDL